MKPVTVTFKTKTHLKTKACFKTCPSLCYVVNRDVLLVVFDLQLFSDFEFGEQCLNTVHLSERYLTSADSYYRAAVTVDLP